jgi:hypothetical protein
VNTPYGGAPSPGRKPRLLDEAQEQLLEEILMSINLAVMEGRVSLSSAQGALAMADLRLEAIVVEAMASDVDEAMGAEPDDEPDVNAFLRRTAGDADDDA